MAITLKLKSGTKFVYFELSLIIISLKLSSSDSRFSIMSAAKTSGSGKLSRPANIRLSLSVEAQNSRMSL
jgi:hypothetical protein